MCSRKSINKKPLIILGFRLDAFMNYATLAYVCCPLQMLKDLQLYQTCEKSVLPITHSQKFDENALNTRIAFPIKQTYVGEH